MPTKKVDLRSATVRERWKIDQTMALQPKGVSAAGLARKLGIDRRTVRRHVQQSSSLIPKKEHSELNEFAMAVLQVMKKGDIAKVQKHFRFKKDTKDLYSLPRGTPRIARARSALELSVMEIEDYRTERRSDEPEPSMVQIKAKRFLNERMSAKHLLHIQENSKIISEMTHGIMIANSENFLRSNIEIVNAAIRSHPAKKPRHIFEELRFCFWYMFGLRGQYWIESGIGPGKLRYHIHKIKNSEK